MQAAIDQLRFQNRQKELQLQIDTEKQAILEMAQQEGNLKRRQMMWHAVQGDVPFTQEMMATSAFNYYGVQLGSTPFTHFCLLNSEIRL